MAQSAPEASSCAGDEVGAKRGVTATPSRPRPCQRAISAALSSKPPRASSRKDSGALRSIITLPPMARSPRASASAMKASTEAGWMVQNDAQAV